MRYVLALLTACVLAVLAPTAAYAGSPHFVQGVNVSTSGSTITVSGKIAGLGDETQVHVELTVQASCVNRGGNNPSAANKITVTAAGDFPVQNGKAIFSLTGTATFQPNCAPPMQVVFGPGTLTDAEHGLTFSF